MTPSSSYRSTSFAHHVRSRPTLQGRRPRVNNIGRGWQRGVGSCCQFSEEEPIGPAPVHRASKSLRIIRFIVKKGVTRLLLGEPSTSDRRAEYIEHRGVTSPWRCRVPSTRSRAGSQPRGRRCHAHRHPRARPRQRARAGHPDFDGFFDGEQYLYERDGSGQFHFARPVPFSVEMNLADSRRVPRWRRVLATIDGPRSRSAPVHNWGSAG